MATERACLYYCCLQLKSFQLQAIFIVFYRDDQQLNVVHAEDKKKVFY